MTAQEVIRMYVFNNENLYNLLAAASGYVMDAEVAAEWFEKWLRVRLNTSPVGDFINKYFERCGLSLDDVDFLANGFKIRDNTSLKDFDYLTTLPKYVFSDIIALEVDNSIKEQLKFKEYLDKLLA